MNPALWDRRSSEIDNLAAVSAMLPWKVVRDFPKKSPGPTRGEALGKHCSTAFIARVRLLSITDASVPLEGQSP